MGIKKKAARQTKSAAATRTRTRPLLARRAKSNAVKYQQESEPGAEEEDQENNEDVDSEHEPDSDTAEVEPFIDDEDDVRMALVAQAPKIGLETTPTTSLNLPPTYPRICMTCDEAKRSDEMVSVNELPMACRKCFPRTCRSCMDMYLDRFFFTNLGANMDTECPMCLNIRSLETLEHFLGKERVEGQLERMTHRLLESSTDFRWCAADKCVSGQFYDQKEIEKPGGEKVCCGLCESQNCFSCRAVWHKGLTCEQYQDPDLRKHRGKRGGDTDVRKAMRKGNTKKCPHCNTAVERTTGCNMVHCTQCGKNFDYNAAAKI